MLDGKGLCTPSRNLEVNLLHFLNEYSIPDKQILKEIKTDVMCIEMKANFKVGNNQVFIYSMFILLLTTTISQAGHG